MKYLFLGFLMVITFTSIYLVLGVILGFRKLREKDNTIVYAYSFLFLLFALFISLLTAQKNFLFFFIISGFVGIFFEFTINLLYHLMFGRRLYRYYRNNIFSYTSWDTFVLWGAASWLFFSIWYLLSDTYLPITGFYFLIEYFGAGFISSFMMLGSVGFIDYFKHQQIVFSGDRRWKFLVLFSFSLGGVLYTTFLYGRELFLYYVIAGSVGVLLEGLLGKSIRKIRGSAYGYIINYL